MSERVHIQREFSDLAIDATGEIAETSVEIAKLVSLNIVGDSTADYALDVSPDGETWFADEATYSGTDIRDVFDLTDRFVRFRVTAAAGAGDTANITVQGVR